MATEHEPFTSPFYPFKKVILGSNTLKGAELIPYKILSYLMDMPDAAGYSPPDDNEYPRCRLLKYLWYDTPNPLAQPRPTSAEVRSMLFDPRNPALSTDEDEKNHPKGYRLYAQRQVVQSELEAKTMLKIYPGRILDTNDFRTIITMQAEIWTSYALETNTKTTAYDRTFDVEQCLREAIAGVDIGGVGVATFARMDSSYNGSEILYSTDGTMLGRIVYFSIAWSEGGGDTIRTC